jgi:phosphoglycolate phosphatase
MRAVFDLDGTLIDSAPDIHAAALATLAAEGLPPVTEAQTRSFVGNGAAVLVERLERAAAGSADPARTARMRARFMAEYQTAHALTRPYPGVVAALDALRADGWRLAICTNKPIGPTHAILSHLGWTGMFDAVFGGDSLAVMKPDPAPLHAAAQALGAGPLVFVGDSEVDAATARAADVAFALYLGGYLRVPLDDVHHDARFSDWAHLPAVACALAR